MHLLPFLATVAMEELMDHKHDAAPRFSIFAKLPTTTDSSSFQIIVTNTKRQRLALKVRN